MKARFARKQVFLSIVVALAVVTGGLLASNLGFRLIYDLLGPVDSASGTNWVSLPYRGKPGLANASDLYADLGGGAFVSTISRFDPTTGNLETYDGVTGDFALTPGEGLVVTMLQTVSYEITGSHNPQQQVTLLGPQSAPSATSLFAPPYHSNAGTASELMLEIGAVEVQRLLRSNDAIEIYSGIPGDVDFPLVKGEAYRVKVDRDIQHVPKVHF